MNINLSREAVITGARLLRRPLAYNISFQEEDPCVPGLMMMVMEYAAYWMLTIGNTNLVACKPQALQR